MVQDVAVPDTGSDAYLSDAAGCGAGETHCAGPSVCVAGSCQSVTAISTGGGDSACALLSGGAVEC
jgi:hypothetical protein